MAEITFTCAGSNAPTEIGRLVQLLVRRGARVVPVDSAEAPEAALHLIDAATPATASPLIEKHGFEARRRCVVLGCEGTLDTRVPPKPGSLGALLEAHRPLGALALGSVVRWRSARPAFFGSKRLAERLGCAFHTTQQTATYAAWLNAPGTSAAEFLLELVRVA
jgi:hypothetical protein